METGDPSIGGNDLGFVRRDDDHSRCSVLGRRMSASGYKQTSRGQLANVCFTPNSGHKCLGRGMSAYDPKRTLAALDAERPTVLSVTVCDLIASGWRQAFWGLLCQI